MAHRRSSGSPTVTGLFSELANTALSELTAASAALDPNIDPSLQLEEPQAGDKRPHTSAFGEDEIEEGPAGSTCASGSIQHHEITTFATQVALSKRLKPSETEELVAFARAPLARQQVIIYAALIQQRVEAAQCQNWTMSSFTEKNVKTFTALYMICPSVPAYDFPTAQRVVWNIVASEKWDIPAAIFSNPSHAMKIKERIKTELTQLRSTFKKKIAKSLEGAEKGDRMHLYDFANSLVDNKEASVTIQLCSRVAIWRKVYPQAELLGTNFWELVDTSLKEIRDTCAGNTAALTLTIKKILEDDLAQHGGQPSAKLSQTSDGGRLGTLLELAVHRSFIVPTDVGASSGDAAA